MRTAIIRAASTPDHPCPAYLLSVGRDGSFAITYRKEKARRFVPDTARATLQKIRAANMTRMTLEVCEVQP